MLDPRMFANVTAETPKAQFCQTTKCSAFGMKFRWVVKALFCCLSLCALLLAGTGSAKAAAHFSGYQTTVGSGFNSPCATALDKSGDVFVSDFMAGKIYEIVAINGSVSSSSTVNLIASMTSPCGLAFDASGNLYVGGSIDVSNDGGYIAEIVASNGVVSSSSTVNTITTASFTSVRHPSMNSLCKSVRWTRNEAYSKTTIGVLKATTPKC